MAFCSAKPPLEFCHLSKKLESIVVLKSIAVCSERILRYAADEGGSMRKVVATELVSLDGVMEKPEEWAPPYSNDEMEQANASGMAASDALLLGRVTYEGLAAFWPNQPAGTPMVDYINSVPKHVLSTTLKEPLEWQNSTLIKGNGAEEIAELKRQPGKVITILGSGALVRLLLRDGLLDELRLMVHPIVLGRGKRLFEEGGAQKALELVDSKTFGTGVLYLSYQPTQS
jgi:dihydrofolate reductase